MLKSAGAPATLATTPAWPAASTEEPVLLPDLAIIDPHHHLWDTPLGAARGKPYLVPELARDLDSGHHIVSTVYLECGSYYREDGPKAMRPIGETEFVIAATRNDPRMARGIVGFADLRLGAAVQPVLESHVAAGNGRFKGIRQSSAYDPAPLFGQPMDPATSHLLADGRFRTGFSFLARYGLSFDAWCFHPNLPDVIELAAAFPETNMILDHIGSPIGIGPYADRSGEVFADWKKYIRALSRHPNVAIKFGGLGMAFVGPPLFDRNARRTSVELEKLWRPWFEICIEAFGARRCMFESNFPVDAPNSSYRTLWNAFKRLAAQASASERNDLFAGTATRVYRLG